MKPLHLQSKKKFIIKDQDQTPYYPCFHNRVRLRLFSADPRMTSLPCDHKSMPRIAAGTLRIVKQIKK